MDPSEKKSSTSAHHGHLSNNGNDVILQLAVRVTTSRGQSFDLQLVHVQNTDRLIKTAVFLGLLNTEIFVCLYVCLSFCDSIQPRGEVEQGLRNSLI